MKKKDSSESIDLESMDVAEPTAERDEGSKSSSRNVTLSGLIPRFEGGLLKLEIDLSSINHTSNEDTDSEETSAKRDLLDLLEGSPCKSIVSA
ncbi:hypothetical protein BGZ94_000059 [Podila epigama]|nr:hypothetical protein BGZ94_000059 [Podila epigama]